MANHPIIPPGYFQFPNTISITPEDTKRKMANKPICRDFLNGRCYRKVCAYQHNLALLKPTTAQTTYKEQQHHQQLIPLFQHMFIPGKGYCFISLYNYIQQTAFNGLFIINLSDIIPTSMFSKLLISTDHTKKSAVIEQISSLACEWNEKLQQIIKWSHTSTANFNKSNYELVFIYDISHEVCDWITKTGYTYKHSANNLIQSLSNKLTQLFTKLFSYSEHLEYPLKNMNIIINYMNDELSWLNKGLLEMLIGMITFSPGKYISTQFYNNIYYVGLPPNLGKSISSMENKGFIFSSITGSKFINLAMIYMVGTTGFEITSLADPEINANIQAYNWHLSNNHNLKIYQTLFEKNDILKKTFASIIPTDNIRAKSLVIIGCNLDVDFDKQILSGLKEVVGAIDFKRLVSSKHGTILNKTSQDKKSTDECCLGDDSSSITMSIILPILSSSGSSCKSVKDTPTSHLNDMMRGLLSTGQIPPSSFPNCKIVQNRVCTLGVKIINTADGKLAFIQPWQTIPGIEKIKEYSLDPDNKIIILCSSRLNHTFFQDFIGQITKTPGYTNKIAANFIDFNINPSLRGCLSYYNYRAQVQANYGNIGQCQTQKISNGTDNLLIKNTKLWLRLTQHISVINPNFDTERVATDFQCHHVENLNDCCQCCSCLSRNGVGYVKFGNIPYIPKTTLDEIKDDSWLPRF